MINIPPIGNKIVPPDSTNEGNCATPIMNIKVINTIEEGPMKNISINFEESIGIPERMISEAKATLTDNPVIIQARLLPIRISPSVIGATRSGLIVFHRISLIKLVIPIEVTDIIGITRKNNKRMNSVSGSV